MNKITVIALALGLASVFCFAEKVEQNFEKKDALKDWEIEGDVKIVTDQKHAGKSSLSVPVGGSAIWRFGKKDKYGKASIWVFDTCVNNKENKPGKKWDGPYFGLVNADEDKVVMWVSWRDWLKSVWGICFTGESQFNKNWYPKGSKRISGWQNFIFEFPDAKTLTVTQDEKETTGFEEKVEYFKRGASGLVFNGGKTSGKEDETFYYDDIEITLK